jgi:hypothetical protein
MVGRELTYYTIVLPRCVDFDDYMIQSDNCHKSVWPYAATKCNETVEKSSYVFVDFKW